MATPLDSRGFWPSLGEFTLYVAAVLVVLGLVAAAADLSSAARDLADNDGYMRFLRIQQLAEGGDWFNPVSLRSNFPYGETLHWTRPLDVYVLSLSALLTPFLGSGSLYWAAFVSGPLLLIVLGPLTYWAVGWLLAPSIRSILMPATLGLPLVVAYFGFGRVDHHGLILLAFVLLVGLTLRTLRDPRRTIAGLLGLAMAFGLWVSVEFLVPWALVASSFALLIIKGRRQDVADAGAFAFAVVTVTTLCVVLVERGSLVGGYERVSMVHVALAATATVILLTAARLLRSRLSQVAQTVAAVSVGLIGCVVSIVVFPGLIRGPFTAFDNVVRERWLSQVTELLPISLSEGPGLILFRVLPILLGVVAWELVRRRYSGDELNSYLVLFSWLLAYAGLTLAQFRWVLFSHWLALVLALVALTPLYERLGLSRLAFVFRPLVVAALLALPLLGSQWTSRSTGSLPTGVDCALKDVLVQMNSFQPTTVLADLDIGPEILYRTGHNVIATPYGNSSALRFLLETMESTDDGAVARRLAERSVGLILLCPTIHDLTYPQGTDGTFYEALVDGPLPEFVDEIPLPDHTDYLLFAVH